MFLNDIEKEKPRASMLQLNTLVLGRVPSMDSNRVGMVPLFAFQRQLSQQWICRQTKPYYLCGIGYTNWKEVKLLPALEATGISQKLARDLKISLRFLGGGQTKGGKQ